MNETAGFVRFDGVATGGFMQDLTEVFEVHCCDACHEARTTLPGHRGAMGCWFNPDAARAVDEGRMETIFRDGEWRLVLTDEGREAFSRASASRKPQAAEVKNVTNKKLAAKNA